MKIKNIIASCLIIAASSLSVNAQDLISVADLNKAIMKKSVIVVDARSAAKYKADAHIKNAVNLGYKELQLDAPIKGVLISTPEIEKMIGNVGIDGSTSIVVYDEGSGKYAGRVYWILKYMGISDVKVLDGNLKAWKAGRKPITKNPTMVKKTKFTAKLNASIIASMADAKKSGVVLIDARSAAEFNGSDGKSKGHIPGAKNIEFKQVLNEDGTLKNADQLAKVFTGVDKSKEVILYCETSVRAGIIYLALTSSLGYTNVKIYEGAYNEWLNASNPLEK